MSRLVSSTLLLAALQLASPATLMAQGGSQGTFVGTVADSSGASIPGAKVAVVNTGTTFTTETTTNVPFWNYRIRA